MEFIKINVHVCPQTWYGVTQECWDSALASYPARMMSRSGCLRFSWTSAHISMTHSLSRYSSQHHTNWLLGTIRVIKNQHKFFCPV